MALTGSYLVTTKNLEAFLNALQTAKAPERFTMKFVSDLGFASSNDRLFISLLKSLQFVDESGIPTKRYFDYLDQSQAGRILAEAVKDAYEDLFSINIKAHNLSVDEVKNKLRTLTQGSKSDNVVQMMANTFRALCDLADWDAPPAAIADAVKDSGATPEIKIPVAEPQKESNHSPSQPNTPPPMRLVYDINIHLPESRDQAVYDAIFQAMRKHLSS